MRRPLVVGLLAGGFLCVVAGAIAIGVAYLPAMLRLFDEEAPDGVYLMMRFDNSVHSAVWHFAPDGTVIHGYRGDDEQRGRYEVRGTKLRVTWADGTKTEEAYMAGDDGFVWNAGIFSKVQPYADTRALIGKWQGEHALELRGDGTYQLDAATGRWTLDGDSLVFREADGTQVRRLAFPYEEWLVLGGEMYRRPD